MYSPKKPVIKQEKVKGSVVRNSKTMKKYASGILL